MKRLISICILSSCFAGSFSQIIFTESFTLIRDSANVSGSVTPEIRIRTQKEILTEIDNLADLTLRVKDSYLTFANRIEFSKYGDELALSSGYIYAELANFTDKKIIPEYYGQIIYDHPRGLQIKYAAGVNARVKILSRNKVGIYYGIGPFYEYEKWTYSGVEDSLIPIDRDPVISDNFKLTSYISYKQDIFKSLNLDISSYFQSKFNNLFQSPRLASSYKVGWFISNHFEVLAIYQNIYDFDPVVPINNWYHIYYATISIHF